MNTALTPLNDTHVETPVEELENVEPIANEPLLVNNELLFNEVPVNEVPAAPCVWSELALQPPMVQAVTDLGYTVPTPIQDAVIPVMLDGRDVIGQAQTGTGKTAAFALPILQRLDPITEPVTGKIQALILAPTRELAIQVAKAFRTYGRHLKLSVLAIYGGQPYGPQIDRLQHGVDVVVGTPGRVLDLIQREDLDLSGVRTVVLDEADEMLSMGFIEDIEAILDETPSNRQTTLFSATMPLPIRQLADRYLQTPETLSVSPKQPATDTVEQRYYLIYEEDKLAALTRLFEMDEIASALIFTRTRVGTGELANELSLRGFPTEALSGHLSQSAREHVLNRFRRHQIKVLVATDVAARGLDIDGISHVFNYDPPQDPETYVHRIGRTGRAGKTGVAISLITPKERWYIRRLEAFTKQKIEQAKLPTAEEIQAQREAALLERMMVWLRRGRYRRESEMVAELVEAGCDLVEIAAAALKVARAEERQRPIAPVSEVRFREPEQRRGRDRDRRRDNRDSRDSRRGRPERVESSHEAGMVRLTLSAGKVHGVRPNDVVGTIAHHANIPGHTIGAIRIREHHTLVDVPEEHVAQVLAKAGHYQIRRRAVTVECA
ncbi:DEAD/DEAH box helicase [Candidatus Entotheonella palauensis]|nr:DEAD/DEAH box helicase [Candidatus Entotheonella palauensis]